MKKKYLNYLAAGALCVPLTYCAPQQAVGEYSWQDELNEELPLLGHRNWIVITDMAYPLQTQPGIKTLFADESYVDILKHVYNELEKAPHVKPVIYQDKELSFLSDKDAQGIDALKKEMKNLLGNQVYSVPHEELIARLDEVSKMFHVIIIKSNLTIPYTSTFFELDCAYWGSSSQQALDGRMKLDL
jgi:D-ribose pyranose/furanose isomerase RbsD